MEGKGCCMRDNRHAEINEEILGLSTFQKKIQHAIFLQHDITQIAEKNGYSKENDDERN